MDGLADRLAALRAARGLSVKDLAARTGLSYGELVRLEADPRHQPPPHVMRRLAAFFWTSEEYMRSGADPAREALRAGFFSYYDSLGPADQQELKMAPIQRRVEAVILYLETAFPTVMERSRVAAGLGYTTEALESVLDGTAPLQSHLLRQLSQMVGLSQEFFVRGDFFGGAAPGDSEIDPARLSQYYDVVVEAIAAGISPGMLRKAVRVLAIRENET